MYDMQTPDRRELQRDYIMTDDGEVRRQKRNYRLHEDDYFEQEGQADGELQYAR